MAKHQFLTGYQKGIVKRYYEHKDTVNSQKLSELVSELYLAEADGNKKKCDKLWKTAEAALLSAKIAENRVESVIKERNLKALADLVSEIA